MRESRDGDGLRSGPGQRPVGRAGGCLIAAGSQVRSGQAGEQVIGGGSGTVVAAQEAVVLVAHGGARLGGQGEEPALGVHLSAMGPHGGDLRGQVRGGVDVDVDLVVGHPERQRAPVLRDREGVGPVWWGRGQLPGRGVQGAVRDDRGENRETVHGVPSSGWARGSAALSTAAMVI